MTNYGEIWQSLNAESAESDARSFVWRKIPTVSGIPLFLGSSVVQGIRYLYVHESYLTTDFPDLLPLLRGITVSRARLEFFETSEQTFFEIRQLLPQNEVIAEYFLSDISATIENENMVVNLTDCVRKVFTDWLLFFEEGKQGEMTIKAQQGLYGELSVLSDYLLEFYPKELALSAWTGPEASNHDFQIKKSAIEVKTTSEKAHHKFSITSEKQLDSMGLEYLVLVLTVLAVHENRPEKGLVNLIEQIKRQLEDPLLIHLFNTKLIKAGFNIEKPTLYNTGFTQRSREFFLVQDSFPRILTSDLPVGIGDLRYSISRAACEPYKKSAQIIKTLF